LPTSALMSVMAKVDREHLYFWMCEETCWRRLLFVHSKEPSHEGSTVSERNVPDGRLIRPMLICLSIARV